MSETAVDRYAVVGNPIAHSKSPAIHGMFAQHTGEPIEYAKVLIEKGHFEKDVAAFFAGGGKGLNVTVPFKGEAYRYADQLTERGRLAGAINTLALQADGSILGDNTDGAGFIKDLNRLGWRICGGSVLILGAGGAAMGLLHPLLLAGPTRVVIANRTASKAQHLAATHAEFGNVSGCGYEGVGAAPFDLVINATASSLQGELPAVSASILASHSCVYDLMYADQPTVFLRWAKQQGAAEVADGLGMLVGQAAEAFRVWRNVSPPMQPILKALRN